MAWDAASASALALEALYADMLEAERDAPTPWLERPPAVLEL